MNTAHLYAEILANPADDTVRLAYADACEEEGGPMLLARAEFIRTQFELHRIGPKPYELSGLVNRFGPQYFDLDVSVDAPVGIGDRVNVNVADGSWRKIALLRKDAPRLHNLLVTKVLGSEGGGYGTRRFALKRDEQSVPYPAERVKELDEKCKKLAYVAYENMEYVHPYLFRRGFVESIRLHLFREIKKDTVLINDWRKIRPLREVQYFDPPSDLVKEIIAQYNAANPGLEFVCIWGEWTISHDVAHSFRSHAVREYENFDETLRRIGAISHS